MGRRPGLAATLFGLTLGVALLVMPAEAHAVRKIGLSSGKFEFNTAEGQSGKGEIVVTNDGDEPLEVLVYAADQIVAEDGSVSYSVPTAGDANQRPDAASWLQLTIPEAHSFVGNVPYLAMQPGDAMSVHFTFTVPVGASPGDHQAIVFYHIKEPEASGTDFTGAQATITGRLGARITIRVAGEVVQQLAIRPFHLRGFVIGTMAPYSYVIRNTGNVDEHISARLQLLDRDDDERFSTTLVEGITAYPGTALEQAGTAELDVPPGRYTARLIVEYASQTGAKVPLSVSSDRSIWVIPLWMVIAAALIAGVFVLWGSWRMSVARARRSRAQTDARRRERQARAQALREHEAGLRESEQPAAAHDEDDGPARS